MNHNLKNKLKFYKSDNLLEILHINLSFSSNSIIDDNISQLIVKYIDKLLLETYNNEEQFNSIKLYNKLQEEQIKKDKILQIKNLKYINEQHKLQKIKNT